MTRINLEHVADVLATLYEIAEKEGLTEGFQGPTFKKINYLLQFLQGYLGGFEFRPHEPYDFMHGYQTDEVYQTLFGRDKIEQSPISSYNITRKIDDHVISELYLTESLSEEWCRFAYVKEACHVIFLRMMDEITLDYPYTCDHNSLLRMFQSTTTEPFSINDFDDPSYEVSLALENAAEVLAFFIMVPIEHLLDEQAAYVAMANGHIYDPQEFASQYKVPHRYVELFVSTPKTAGIARGIKQHLPETYSYKALIDRVPPPLPAPSPTPPKPGT